MGQLGTITGNKLFQRIFHYSIIGKIKFSTIYFLLVLSGCSFTKKSPSFSNVKNATLHLSNRIVSLEEPDFYNALYVEKEGVKLLGRYKFSEDNGNTWSKYTYKPDFLHAGLPYGYRRDRVTALRDPIKGSIIAIVNAMDILNLDPSLNEPKVALSTYYLRYAVSNDAGNTWLFDDPIVQSGNYTQQNPFEGIFIGRNSIYQGDVGCVPIVNKQGKILVPVQSTIAGSGRDLLNPGGGYTYTDVMVLLGEWTNGNKLLWKASEKVKADPKRSTRGLIEPTILEMHDGRILMVMRGSNGGKYDPNYQLPSYKWFAISKDGGETWSKPAPWCFEDGAPFFSPSSMSTLFKHSSGRCFWVGNMSKENCREDLFRWPLFIAELNTQKMKLIRSSILTVDTQSEEDLKKGGVDITYASLLEDRVTKEIILTYPRITNSDKTREWITVRLSLNKTKN